MSVGSKREIIRPGRDDICKEKSNEEEAAESIDKTSGSKAAIRSTGRIARGVARRPLSTFRFMK